MGYADESGSKRDASVLALGSCLLGLVTLLAALFSTGALQLDEYAAGATRLGAIALVLALTAPFLAGLAALHPSLRPFRRPIWLASGLVALTIAIATLASGIGFLVGAAALGLLASWWQSRSPSSVSMSRSEIVLALWLSLCFFGALCALYLGKAAMCWDAHGGWSFAETNLECRSGVVTNSAGILALALVGASIGGIACISSYGTASGKTPRTNA
ncbi:MAG: hypothetical protein QM692_20440 [Thermomicrobiales bacterium]